MAEVVDQQALRQDLHPGADAGGAGAYPDQPEIAILKGLEDFLKHGEGYGSWYSRALKWRGCLKREL
jgi:hypothetical protein